VSRDIRGRTWTAFVASWCAGRTTCGTVLDWCTVPLKHLNTDTGLPLNHSHYANWIPEYSDFVRGKQECLNKTSGEISWGRELRESDSWPRIVFPLWQATATKYDWPFAGSVSLYFNAVFSTMQIPRLYTAAVCLVTNNVLPSYLQRWSLDCFLNKIFRYTGSKFSDIHATKFFRYTSS
jgi:hypothetical protein